MAVVAAVLRLGAQTGYVALFLCRVDNDGDSLLLLKTKNANLADETSTKNTKTCLRACYENVSEQEI